MKNENKNCHSSRFDHDAYIGLCTFEDSKIFACFTVLCLFLVSYDTKP